MGKFRNDATGVVVSVADEKDGRYPAGSGWAPYTGDDAAQAPDVGANADQAGNDATGATPPATGAPAAAAPDDTWTVAELTDYADAQGVDLGGATRKADILAAINGK